MYRSYFSGKYFQEVSKKYSETFWRTFPKFVPKNCNRNRPMPVYRSPLSWLLVVYRLDRILDGELVMKLKMWESVIVVRVPGSIPGLGTIFFGSLLSTLLQGQWACDITYITLCDITYITRWARFYHTLSENIQNNSRSPH